MSAEREELLRLVEGLDEAQVQAVLAAVKERARPSSTSPWPPAFFGSGQAGRSDTAARAEELLADGFGR